MTPEEKYKEVEILLKRLSEEMSQVVQAFYLWSSLFSARNIHEVGKEQAEKNVEIMSKHKNFFVQTEDSHISRFIIGISKFYDKDPRALTFDAVIKKMRAYKDDVTADTLISLFPDRFVDKEEMKSTYKPFCEDDLSGINELRQENEEVLEQLREIRNKRLAHTDIETVNTTFVPNKVEKLIEDTQKMFNKLQGRFCRASTMWDQMKDGAERDTQLLIENLHRGEAERIREINEKWGD